MRYDIVRMSVRKKTPPPRRSARSAPKRAASLALLTENRYHELFDALAEGVVISP